MGSCCSCCGCGEDKDVEGQTNADPENPHAPASASSGGKRLKNKRPIQSSRSSPAARDKQFRPMSYGSSGNELQDVASYHSFQPLDESFNESPRNSRSSTADNLISKSSNSSTSQAENMGHEALISDPKLQKLAVRQHISIKISRFRDRAEMITNHISESLLGRIRSYDQRLRSPNELPSP
jgi:hypothetical protein